MEVRTISIEDNKVSLRVIDNETGQDSGELHDIEFVDLNVDVAEERNDYEQYKKSLSAEYTLTFETDNSDELKKIFGVDVDIDTDLPNTYDVQFVKLIQARKHRKKRINKKWLKRYGVKRVIVDSKGWQLQSIYELENKFL